MGVAEAALQSAEGRAGRGSEVEQPRDANQHVVLGALASEDDCARCERVEAAPVGYD